MVVLISLSKHKRKDFQVIIAFCQGTFTTSLSVCSYKHRAEKILSLSNIQQMSATQH